MAKTKVVRKRDKSLRDMSRLCGETDNGSISRSRFILLIP